MVQENEKREPDFTGNGIAVWVKKDKNGNNYLAIQILGGLYVNAFKHTPKPKKVKEETYGGL